MERSPDVELVRRAQQGDRAAFAELFTRYERRIFGYLYRMVGERAWAEDLAQEAFIQAHQHLGRLGPPHDFKSWLYRIAGNLAIDGLRRYRREVPLPDWEGGEATALEPADGRPEADPERQARLSEIRATVWQTLHRLPDAYRQILILREVSSFSYREIAAALGISIDSVKVTLHRARLQFRELYGLQVMVEEGRVACLGLDELLSAEIDGELDGAARRRVKRHIDSCPSCQRKRKDLLAVSSLLAALAPVFPPPTLRARFLTRLWHLPAPEAVPTALPGARRPAGGGPPARVRFVWLALAGGAGGLLLLAALVFAVLVLFPWPSAPGVPPTVSVSPSPSHTPTAQVLPPVGTSPTPYGTSTRSPLPTVASPTASAPAEVSPTATRVPPSPTPSPTPLPPPLVAFWVSPAVVEAGSCADVRWETANVQAVFYDGQGVPGVGSERVCPCAPETHTLDVLLPDGSHDIRSLTVQVVGSCPTPTPDVTGPPPPAPEEPVGGVTLGCRSQVTLSWGAVSDPSDVSGYHVELALGEAGAWQSAGTWGPMGARQLSVPVSCGSSYGWRVRAEDGLGNLGAWSEWAGFVIGTE